MTASPDELAELRRRAYGPDAVADPTDLDRLQALEDARHDEPEPASEPGSTPEADAEPPADPVDPVATVAAASAPPAAPLREVLRRRRVLLGLGVVALVAAAVSIVWLFSTRDATVLRQVGPPDFAAEPELGLAVGGFGVDQNAYVQYESFERFEILSASPSSYDSICLIVYSMPTVSASASGLYGYSCTPVGMDPIVDVVQYSSGADTALGDRPRGTVARFELRGDHVEVTVREGEPRPTIPTPAPR